MSNNNLFWGRRFGSTDPTHGSIFRIKRPSLAGSSNNNSAKHRIVNKQSQMQKEAFTLMMSKVGLPKVIYNSSRKRIGISHNIKEYM